MVGELADNFLRRKTIDFLPSTARAEIDDEAVHSSPCLVVSSWSPGVILLS